MESESVYLITPVVGGDAEAIGGGEGEHAGVGGDEGDEGGDEAADEHAEAVEAERGHPGLVAQPAHPHLPHCVQDAFNVITYHKYR